MPDNIKQAALTELDRETNQRARWGAVRVAGFCLVGVVLGYMNEPEPNFYGTPLDDLMQMQESKKEYHGPLLDEILNIIEVETEEEKLKPLFQTLKQQLSLAEQTYEKEWLAAWPQTKDLLELMDHVPDTSDSDSKWPSCERLISNYAHEYSEPTPSVHRYFNLLYTKLLLVCQA